MDALPGRSAPIRTGNDSASYAGASSSAQPVRKENELKSLHVHAGDSFYFLSHGEGAETSIAPGDLSPGLLLQQGLDYVQQGDYAEGAALLAIVRTHLPPQQHDLAAALDAFLQGFTQYKRAQKMLQAVSVSYAETSVELEKHAANLAAYADSFSEYEFPHPSAAQLSRVGIVGSKDEPHHPGATQASHPHILATPAPTGMMGTNPQRAQTNLSDELFITCFGHFEVRRLGNPIMLCTSRKGQGIFRYLIAQPEHAATSDTLQALFWPEDGPEVAQQKLHVAISALRRWFKNDLVGSAPLARRQQAEGEYITCKGHIYALSAATIIETDVDRFLYWYHTGQQQPASRVACYERACNYYAGPFLTEDRYADWSFLPRERLSQIYLSMCRVVADHYLQVKRYDDALKWANALLNENACDEPAHRLLMQTYAAQGRRTEALQHYQRCVRLLATELGVQPLPETQALYQALLTLQGGV